MDMIDQLYIKRERDIWVNHLLELRLSALAKGCKRT
jgi:hypothetical protein